MNYKIETPSGYDNIRNPELIAPICRCGLVMDPTLINITTFNGPVRWIVEWQCVARFNLNHEKQVRR